MTLFLRTFSQGLQAFMPIAVALAWCHVSGQRRCATSIRRGLWLALPASFAGAWLFRSITNQALTEALLAVCAIAIAIWFTVLLRPSGVAGVSHAPGRLAFWSISAAACIIVVRQTMEQLSLLHTATVELRSLDATFSLTSGVVASGAVAWLFTAAARRLRQPVLRDAVWTFVALFVVQGVIYAFHESAEAHLLPWSEILHAASEPYGPDGAYGIHFSELLVIVPAAAVVWSVARARLDLAGVGGTLITHRRAAAAITLSSCLFMGMQQSDARPPQAAPASRPEDLAAIVARPHILFRDTTSGATFGRLSMVPADAPNAERRSVALTCERLSFAGGRGLCLHLQRGVFNSYTAVLLDKSLKGGATIKLEGLPSRTRSSPDGRVGAITVFVLGDDYAADFSTRTTMIDLSSGDEIGELEQFSTWRDGARFKEVDFNFWGVTFAKDGNTFYAALRTGGKTFLVRGDLALRKLTVMRENVECPAISPDNRLLAYKKRVGPSPDSWRIHVLDLQTNAERVVAAETRYIDDQVEWLDDRHVLYAIPRRTTTMADVWMAPIDGADASRILLPQAESPVVVR